MPRRTFAGSRAWKRRRTAAVWAVGALLVAGSTALSAAPASASGKPTTSAASKIVYQVHPIALRSVLSTPAASQIPPYSPGMSPGQCVILYGLACYTPQILHSAYQVPWKINGQLAGTGESVAIIDAYGSPTVASDLATFDKSFGLPAANLHVWYPTGKPAYNPRQHLSETGWAEETSLDVQTVHDLAPGATINLVVASSPNGNVLNNAERFAVQNHLGTVMTMSFGIPEAAFRGNNAQLIQANSIYQQAAAQGMSVFASSGDSGATNGYPAPNANFPSSDPYVTSTGGTDLFVASDASLQTTNVVKLESNDSVDQIIKLANNYTSASGAYSNETAWADFNSSTCPFGCAFGPFGAAGGAASAVFPAPSWQTALPSWTTATSSQAAGGSAMRTTSDVAFNTSVYTGTMIYLGFLGGGNNGFYFFGGTSEASPSWAAIIADLDQARAAAGKGPLGLMGPRLYPLASATSSYAANFNNVTVGENNEPAKAPGFFAGPGYNLPTGLGTPIVTGLLGTFAPGATSSLTGPVGPSVPTVQPLK